MDKARVINNDSNNFNIGEIIIYTGVNNEWYCFKNEIGMLQYLLRDEFEWIN